MPIEDARIRGSIAGAGALSTAQGDSLGSRWAAPASLRAAEVRQLVAADGLALPVHLLRFDTGSFVPSEFAACAIACPASVARSVRKRQAEFLFG
ncbi:MAG: hypothetical protein M3Q11_04985, partial [Pseudomonadota bacterium]|nr:hypothetical protein [Pseudomonadota bacterium]